MMIKTISGMELGGGITDPLFNPTFSNVRADTTCKIVFSFTCNLSPGVYFLNAGVTGEVDGEAGFLHRLLDVAMFRVLPLDSGSCITGTVDFSCIGQADVVYDS
jgi:lipopolysaccharide transport system ATP-binding protein